MVSAPAAAGSHVSEVDTPALLIDLDALERNIRRMQERAAGTKARLRPHAKTHKSTAIANRQIAAGAVGICCQKVSEAEIMVDGGIGDVLISNEVVGKAKIERVAALARRAKISICADDAENVGARRGAARSARRSMSWSSSMSVRTDAASRTPASARLAAAIIEPCIAAFRRDPGVPRSSQHLRTFAERQSAIAGAAGKVTEATRLPRRDGLACDDHHLGRHRHLRNRAGERRLQRAAGRVLRVHGCRLRAQPGSHRQADLRVRECLVHPTTVMSDPVASRARSSRGPEGVGVDLGLPLVVGHDAVSYVSASDEHGRTYHER